VLGDTKNRRTGDLSGGQQLLILDEPAEGIEPPIIQDA
jgi:ABC-type branched-subunit amino acid transport system ATPase component